MGSSGSRPSGSARGQAARLGLWRAIAATPAVIGSLLLVSVAVGALGRWAGLLLLGWAACGAVLGTRVGERFAVRAACGFRSPSPAQAAALQRPWAAALRMTGTAAGDVELYVQTAHSQYRMALGQHLIAPVGLYGSPVPSSRGTPPPPGLNRRWGLRLPVLCARRPQ
jgi:STE24 endopeptidase